jgi:phosphoribosylanthranilate isomerase
MVIKTPLLKICGLTRSVDVELVDNVADFAGFIVDELLVSPRKIDPKLAKDLASILTNAKAVFVYGKIDPKIAIETSRKFDIRILQYHADINPSLIEYARSHDIEIAPVINYKENMNNEILNKFLEYSYYRPIYILVDSDKSSNLKYEHGLKLPLKTLNQILNLNKVGIAGGITPENISYVIRFHPYLIDVSSGVENAPGIKSVEKIMRIVEVIKSERI